MIFADKQLKAINLAGDTIRSVTPKVLRIGGYAGTGKTTILKEICSRSDSRYAVTAFMGKAAQVLRSKGISCARTIHSLIYNFDSRTNQFYKVNKLPEDVSWIAVDEGSTIGGGLWADLLSFRLPIIVMGDPGQLEPVASDDPKLMVDPDIVLDQVHRQALDNPIIGLSMKIRSGDDEERDWRPFTIKGIDKNVLQWSNIVLCGFNKTRVSVNAAYRQHLGFDKYAPICYGERLIVTNNDRQLGVFNGTLLTIVGEDGTGFYRVLVDGEDAERTLKLATIGLNKSHLLKYNDVRRFSGSMAIVDYGYCLTVHKSQGSEFENVTYIDEQCDAWSPERHRYTAVTRASKGLKVIRPV